MTTEAILDAFIVVLDERGYAAATMRGIASVAGVGVGTLYLYFPNKESIAAVAVRRKVRLLASTLSAAPAPDGESHSLAHIAAAQVRAYVQLILGKPREWQQFLTLERRITAPEIYRELYLQHVDIVRDKLAQASDLSPASDVAQMAFTIFTIVDGMLRNSLAVCDEPPQVDALVNEILRIVNAYLSSFGYRTDCP